MYTVGSMFSKTFLSLRFNRIVMFFCQVRLLFVVVKTVIIKTHTQLLTCICCYLNTKYDILCRLRLTVLAATRNWIILV